MANRDFSQRAVSIIQGRCSVTMAEEPVIMMPDRAVFASLRAGSALPLWTLSVRILSDWEVESDWGK